MKTILLSKLFRKGKPLKPYNITQSTTNYKPYSSFTKQSFVSLGQTQNKIRSSNIIKTSKLHHWVKSTSLQNKNSLNNHRNKSTKSKNENLNDNVNWIHKQYTFSYDDDEYRFSVRKAGCEQQYLLTDNNQMMNIDNNNNENKNNNKNNSNNNYNNNNIIIKLNAKKNNTTHNSNLNVKDVGNSKENPKSKNIYTYINNNPKTTGYTNNRTTKETCAQSNNSTEINKRTSNGVTNITPEFNCKYQEWLMSNKKDLKDGSRSQSRIKEEEPIRQSCLIQVNASGLNSIINEISNINISKSNIADPSSLTNYYQKQKEQFYTPSINFIYKNKNNLLSHNTSQKDKKTNNHYLDNRLNHSNLTKVRAYSQTHYWKNENNKHRNINIRTVKKTSIPVQNPTSNSTSNYNYHTLSSRIKSSTISFKSGKYPIVSAFKQGNHFNMSTNLLNMKRDTRKIVMQIVDKLVLESNKESNQNFSKAAKYIQTSPDRNSKLHKINNINYSVISINILSNWGHKSLVGLTEIQLFDSKNKVIPIAECHVFDGNENNIGRIHNNKYRTLNDNDMWVTELNKGLKIELYTLNNSNTRSSSNSVSMIKIWNYNGKELKKGVKEIEIRKKNRLHWKGVVTKGTYNVKNDYSCKIVLKDPDANNINSRGNMSERNRNINGEKFQGEHSFQGKSNVKNKWFSSTFPQKENKWGSSLNKNELDKEMSNVFGSVRKLSNSTNWDDLKMEVIKEVKDFGTENWEWTALKGEMTNHHNMNISEREQDVMGVINMDNAFNDYHYSNHDTCPLFQSVYPNEKQFITFNSIRLTLVSNYGHKAFIGLSGISWHDKDGNIIPIESATSVGAKPKDISTELNNWNDHRIFENVFNGINHTTDENEMWLTVFGPRPYIEIYFEKGHTLSFIDIWNYNAPNSFDKCVKELNICFDYVMNYNILLHKGGGIEGWTGYNQRISFPFNNSINKTYINIDKISRFINSNISAIETQSSHQGKDNEEKCGLLLDYVSPVIASGFLFRFVLVSNFGNHKCIGIENIWFYDINNHEISAYTQCEFYATKIQDIEECYNDNAKINPSDDIDVIEKERNIYYDKYRSFKEDEYCECLNSFMILFEECITVAYIKIINYNGQAKNIRTKGIQIYCDECLIYEGDLGETNTGNENIIMLNNEWVDSLDSGEMAKVINFNDHSSWRKNNVYSEVIDENGVCSLTLE